MIRHEVRRLRGLLRVLREMLGGRRHGFGAVLRPAQHGGKAVRHVVERRCHAPDLIARINRQFFDRQVPARDLLRRISHADERLGGLPREEIGEYACRRDEDDPQNNGGNRRLDARPDHIGMRRCRRDDPSRDRILVITHIVVVPVEQRNLRCSRLTGQRVFNKGKFIFVSAVFFFLNRPIGVGEKFSLAIDDKHACVFVRRRLYEVREHAEIIVALHHADDLLLFVEHRHGNNGDEPSRRLADDDVGDALLARHRIFKIGARRRIHGLLMIAAQELLSVRIRDMRRIGVLENIVRPRQRRVHVRRVCRRVRQIPKGRRIVCECLDPVAVLLEQPRNIRIDYLDALLADEFKLRDAPLHRAVKIDADADEQRHRTDEHKNNNHLGLDACILKHLRILLPH